MMRWLFAVFILSLVQAKSKKVFDYYGSDSSSSEEIEESDYIPDVETTMDYRGTIRKTFALELALRSEGQNMACSPLSALIPIAKLILGSKKRSKTEKELLNAVGMEDRRQVKSIAKTLIENLENLGGVELSLVSRVYLHKDKKLRKRFKSRVQNIFGSAVEPLDMNNQVETARIINTWVSDNTNKKIQNIVDQKFIRPDLSLLLVNAIYFMGIWKDIFPKAQMAKFHSETGGTYDVPMMSRTGRYNYIKYDELNAQILEIPYQGDEAAMVILLPYSSKGLPILLRTLLLSPNLMNDALKKMKTAKVEVSIPKFKIETSLDLRGFYSKMGLKTTMSDKSHLTKIVKDENVYISGAIQKAYILVNECGTEAAAATVITGLSASMYQPIQFTANHPFLFYIVGKKEQLFAGVVNNLK